LLNIFFTTYLLDSDNPGTLELSLVAEGAGSGAGSGRLQGRGGAGWLGGVQVQAQKKEKKKACSGHPLPSKVTCMLLTWYNTVTENEQTYINPFDFF